MKKFFITAGLLVALAVPSAAMAAVDMAPNPNSPAGQATTTWADGPAVAPDFNGSAMGFYNSRVTGQGSYISGQAHLNGGNGAAAQANLGHTE